MSAVPAACAWPLLLLLAAQLGAVVGTPQPWRCAPCSAERLALCPPVPASCPEPTRPAGCGCCPTCALPLGAACGVATARCGRGLSCRALPGEPRPLYVLTRGQGVCMLVQDDTTPSAEATDAKGSMAPENMSPESVEMTQEQLLGSSHLMGPSGDDLPTLWRVISNSQSTSALEVADVKNGKGPCQRELYRVLERLAEEQQKARDGLYTFYLPNCSKNGFYYSKQCETSLDGEAGLCWCVYPWSGKKIPGSVEVRGDPSCHQYFH
nr:PREDICTED: insulin-like growth factor-binding protein 1 [Rhinolophus sinicus]XP_019587114.1 PREDICTED: insulin-like growth factor-binding protein 1 [Rhinolophus sinicus]